MPTAAQPTTVDPRRLSERGTHPQRPERVIPGPEHGDELTRFFSEVAAQVASGDLRIAEDHVPFRQSAIRPTIRPLRMTLVVRVVDEAEAVKRGEIAERGDVRLDPGAIEHARQEADVEMVSASMLPLCNTEQRSDGEAGTT